MFCKNTNGLHEGVGIDAIPVRVAQRTRGDLPRERAALSAVDFCVDDIGALSPPHLHNAIWGVAGTLAVNF